MNLEHFEQKLLRKQRECETELTALKGEGRITNDAEVRDFGDKATADQSTGEALEEAAIVSQTLEKVEDALRRIKEGTYGKCLTCGRQIELARLEAIPWAEYCLADQEKLDQTMQVAQGGSTL